MALPSCERCGKQNPQRMHALMCLWFGPLVELESDLGYFYLCPACHDEIIAPELERIQNRILELHPAAQRHLDETTDLPPVGETVSGDAAAGEDEVAGVGEDAPGSDRAPSPDRAASSDEAGSDEAGSDAAPGDAPPDDASAEEDRSDTG